MRTIWLIGCCVLTAGCQPAAPDRRGVAKDEVLLQVSATGRSDSRPDQARFRAGVQTLGATATEASAGNSRAINAVVAALAKFGVAGADVQTRSITLSRVDYGPNRGRYEANNMIDVRVREVKRAGEAIAAATQAGANVVSGPNLTVSDPEAKSRAAYAAAYRAARARAEEYAKAAGLKVARLLAIRDTGQPSMPDYLADVALMEVAAQATASPPVQPGMNSREVTVQADFALAK
jgi:uncharacterized protein YggE